MQSIGRGYPQHCTSLSQLGVVETLTLPPRNNQAIKESKGNVRLQLRKKHRDIPDVVVKVFDTLPTVAVLVDWDGVVLFANKALKSVLERDREALWHAPYSKVRRTRSPPSIPAVLTLLCTTTTSSSPTSS
jgi:hypothetical protein